MDGRLIVYYILPNHFFYLLFHLNLNDVIYEIHCVEHHAIALHVTAEACRRILGDSGGVLLSMQQRFLFSARRVGSDYTLAAPSASFPSYEHKCAADTNEDGFVSIGDVTTLQRWLVELPSNDHIGLPII